MALLINKEIEFTSGLKADKVLVFVDIHLPKGSQWVNLQYYASKQDFINGRDQVVPLDDEIPTGISFEIPTNVFWGPNLAMVIHKAIKDRIEFLTGENTVQIIQDPYS